MPSRLNFGCKCHAKRSKAKAARLKKIIAALDRTYPEAHCELDHRTRWNCSSPPSFPRNARTSASISSRTELFKKYRSAADYANAPLAELEQAIKTTGFFRNKARTSRLLAASHRRKAWRPGPANDGGIDSTRRRRAQNGQRCSGQRVRHQCRRRRGHARRAVVAPARIDEAEDAGKNRAGFDGARAAKAMDAVQSLAHLAWPPPLLRAQAGLRELRDAETLSANRSEES